MSTLFLLKLKLENGTYRSSNNGLPRQLSHLVTDVLGKPTFPHVESWPSIYYSKIDKNSNIQEAFADSKEKARERDEFHSTHSWYKLTRRKFIPS